MVVFQCDFDQLLPQMQVWIECKSLRYDSRSFVPGRWEETGECVRGKEIICVRRHEATTHSSGDKREQG